VKPLTVRQTGHDPGQEPFSDLGEVFGVLKQSIFSSARLGLFLGNGKDVLARLGVFERYVDVTRTSRQLIKKCRVN
jgi:hypothetical protein